MVINHLVVIRSPETKADLSKLFLSQIVRRRRRCCRTFLTFSSSPEPLDQFQPNLAQSILWWRGFNFVQMKDPALFQREITTKKLKTIDEI